MKIRRITAVVLALFALTATFTAEGQEKSLKRKVAIGRFSNETQYAKSIFYDKDNDPMGKQASDLLSARLAASDKFLLIERQDYDKIVEELNTGNRLSNSIGADYLIIGSITEFGRKTVGTQKLFSSSKEQIVEATVSIRLVDVATGARTGIHGRQTGVGAREHRRLRCHAVRQGHFGRDKQTGGKHHQQMYGQSVAGLPAQL